MRLRSPGAWVLLLFGLVVLALYLRGLTWAMSWTSYNTWGAMIVVPFIVAINATLLSWAWGRESNISIRRIIVAGYALKLLAICARYLMAYVLYGGGSDAERYNRYAAERYLGWRAGEVVWEVEGKQGTLVMELLTTAVYVVTGPSPLAAFFVFGSLAFWGVYLLHRAFKLALPGADQVRYAALVFFVPSVLFWPSSIGKESWLLLFVGVTAYGAALFFANKTVPGLTVMGIGLIGTALVRPHVSVLLVAALFVGQIARPTSKLSTSLLSKAAGVFMMAVAGAILTTQSATFLGIDDLNFQAVADEVAWAGGQTAQGGSSFTPLPLNSPLGIPAAIVTLLFRPFLWETTNPQMLMQVAEGTFLIALVVASWPRFKALPKLMKRSPYLLFALAYTMAFIIAFAGFANFGILARQRVLMLPFFLVLLALPKPIDPKKLKVRDPSRRELVGAGRR